MLHIFKILSGDNNMTVSQDLSPIIATDLKNALIMFVDVKRSV